MKLLSLDPAACCGWAYQDTDAAGLPLYGTWQLTRGAGEHPGQRLERLRGYIYDMHRAHGLDVIAFEDASFGSHNQHVKALHNQLAGVILLTAAELGVEALYAKPNAIKKFVTDDGRATKEQVMLSVYLHLGIKTEDANAADALAVLLWARGLPDRVRTEQAKPKGRGRPRRKKEARLF
jgi:crossover junction endodeoxyribonuclease RuvC